MRNLTILFSAFKKALGNSPHIRVIDQRNQFDPPSSSRIRTAVADLEESGILVEDWLQPIIGLCKGNSMLYHVIRDRQNRGEGAFNLFSPEEFLVEDEPWLAKLGTTDSDRALLRKVRMVDQVIVNQAFTGLIVDGPGITKIPQQLLYFRRGQLLPMDLEFKDYYQALADFMGILDWQLLFTDTNPGDAALRPLFEQLQDSLEAFQLIFPERDFSMWADRLRAKAVLV
jgi:hypothetical protein